jgi:hypothetical protein
MIRALVRRHVTIAKVVQVLAGLLIVGVLWHSASTHLENKHQNECLARIRASSERNPVLRLLLDTLEQLASTDNAWYKEHMRDSSKSSDTQFGRLIISTSNGRNGFLTYYDRDSALYYGKAWGTVQFYRYTIRHGKAFIMSGTTVVAIAGTLAHPIPEWEEFDEYAYKFMRRVGMINENCEVVDSAITAPDGDPKSATFHKP